MGLFCFTTIGVIVFVTAVDTIAASHSHRPADSGVACLAT